MAPDTAEPRAVAPGRHRNLQVAQTRGRHCPRAVPRESGVPERPPEAAPARRRPPGGRGGGGARVSTRLGGAAPEPGPGPRRSRGPSPRQPRFLKGLLRGEPAEKHRRAARRTPSVHGASAPLSPPRALGRAGRHRRLKALKMRECSDMTTIVLGPVETVRQDEQAAGNAMQRPAGKPRVCVGGHAARTPGAQATVSGKAAQAPFLSSRCRLRVLISQQ